MPLTVVFYTLGVVMALPLLLGILLILPIVALDIVGAEGGGYVWEWGWWRLTLLAAGVSIELLIAGIVNLQDLAQAWRSLREGAARHWQS